MAMNPLLERYRLHLADAEFHEARSLLDVLEHRYGRVQPWPEIIALERERLEQCGVVVAPGRSSRDAMPTLRQTAEGVVRERLQQQHNWYFNAELERCLLKAWSESSPHAAAAGFRSLLVLGNNFSLSTGVFRPISHYLNFLIHHGGVRLRSLQLADQAAPKLIDTLLDQHDVVVINGLQQICNVEHLAESVARRVLQRPVLGYLHETSWILNRLPEDQKQRIRNTLPQLDLLLCCQRQLEDFAPYGTPRHHQVIFNPTLHSIPNSAAIRRERKRGHVLMCGTVKERKGVAFFNRCAEALQSRGIRFGWAGQVRDPSVTLSNAVAHHGHLGREALQSLLGETEIFFLSSLEDTFPLAAIEAYLKGCKLLLPRSTGLVEVFEGLEGVRIYEEHQVESLIPLLLQLLEDPAPGPADRYAIATKLGLDAFIQRLHPALQRAHENVQQEDSTARHTDPKSTPTIAVIAHLYYTDLIFELSSQLQAVAGPFTDLYITVPEQKCTPSLLSKLHTIFASRFRHVHCQSVPNRGMDIGPFFSVIQELIKPECASCELILKIHTKKSLKVSGATKGQRWRQGLLEGLLGNRNNVSRILDSFAQEPQLNLLTPEPFLMVQSQRDQTIGANHALVEKLLELYKLPPDPERRFARGSMFWVRSSALLQELSTAPLPDPQAFESGHQDDGSLAHAYERILSYLPQRRGHVLGHQPSVGDA